MYRNWPNDQPEIVAVIAQSKNHFLQWQRENDFYDLPTLRLIYIHEPYQALGIKFTMMYMIGEYWRNKDFSPIMDRVFRQMGNKMRRFGSLDGHPNRYVRPLHIPI